MNNDVWIATLLSVPVSIGTGLVIEPIRRWASNKGLSRAERRHQQLSNEYQKLLVFAANPNEFTQYLMYCCLRAAAAACFLILSSMYAAFAFFFSNPSHFGQISSHPRIDKGLTGIGLMLSLVISFAGGYLLTGFGRAMHYYETLKNPGKYLAGLPDTVVRDFVEEEQAFGLRRKSFNS